MSAANRTISTKKTELEDLQEKVGFGRETGAAEVKAGAEADMKTYGSGIADEASRTYRKVLETVWADAQTGCPSVKRS